MTLVDLPLVRASTVASLLATWHQTHAPLVRPLYQGRHGHPVIFGAPVLDALRSADVGEGAKPVVHRFLSDAVSVPVDDPRNDRGHRYAGSSTTAWAGSDAACTQPAWKA